MLARRAIVDVNSVTTGHALRSHATGAENQPGPVPNTTFEIVTRKPWTAPVTALPTEPDNWVPSLFSVGSQRSLTAGKRGQHQITPLLTEPDGRLLPSPGGVARPSSLKEWLAHTLHPVLLRHVARRQLAFPAGGLRGRKRHARRHGLVAHARKLERLQRKRIQ